MPATKGRKEVEHRKPIPEPAQISVPPAILHLINTLKHDADQYYKVEYGWQGLLEDTIQLLKKWYTPRRLVLEVDTHSQIALWAANLTIAAQEFSRKTSKREYGDRNVYVKALVTATMFAIKLIDYSNADMDATIAALERMV